MFNTTMIHYLPWDSDFFGLRIGRVDISCKEDWRILEQTIAEGLSYNLLYIFDKECIGLPADKAKLVDIKVVYKKDVSNSSMLDLSSIHQYKNRVPDKDLYSLALVSGQYSRYNLDKKFPQGSYERLYRRWIENSVNGQMADAVFYYLEEDTKIGMVTLRREGETASIGLIASAPMCQGKGIGTKLIEASETWLFSKGIKLLEVATQRNNIYACRFYEKLGFVPVSETNIYHLWL